ncbi:UDP-N-acetylenolpyruvoylglucosamine reductase [Frankliniella fusca]|uniref:UDP-N-acetylenolpyruvoylglucosamine reductase n=1 Tax=Frankliniella fusca TaxID=407009 RepID=A0AAE1LJ41_9NEOP|nr:UDP-N-acetylenolpyruvoylglucosamine reductase [Frankliniella fusca]
MENSTWRLDVQGRGFNKVPSACGYRGNYVEDTMCVYVAMKRSFCLKVFWEAKWHISMPSNVCVKKALACPTHEFEYLLNASLI